MSVPESFGLYCGFSTVLTIVLVPLIVIFKKKWNRQQHGQGYSEHVIVFSGYPVAGVTKTRLIGELGEHGAARVQHVMTDHLLNQLSEFQKQRPSSWVELNYLGGSPTQIQYWLGWRKKFGKLMCSWSRQEEGHLGKKMSAAFQKAFDQGAKRVVIVGSDIPGINTDILNLAMGSMMADDGNGADMVLGLAKDGGYYLIELNRNTQSHLGSLFEGIDWGTEKVLSQQKQVAESLKVKINILPQMLQDVLWWWCCSCALFSSSPEPNGKHGKMTRGSLFEGIDWGTEKVLSQQKQVAESLKVKINILPQMLQDVNNPEDLTEFEKTGVSVRQIKEPVLSIVIPVLNETCNIQERLSTIIKNCSYPKYTEIVVSDGGSTDNTVEKVEEFSKHTTFNIRVVKATKGRGPQLNVGAKNAKGDNLLFLHADTRPPRAFDQHVLVTLAVPGVSAGAFQFGLNVLHDDSDSSVSQYSWLSRMQLKVIEYGINFRAKYFELPYGDQTLFMSRQIFDATGGFPDVLLMEDYEMVKRLQKEGHVRIVEDEYAITSARRWQNWGIIRNAMFNNFLIIVYYLGIHPNTLARWYYGVKT